MLKKTITYEDFNGTTLKEDFFFHLSKAELIELEMSHQGGLSATLARIVAAEDAKSIIEEFKNIILTSYGVRSDDGKRFIKSQELREEFVSTEAYSTLFMELVTDTDAAVEFVNGVIPAGMAEEAAKLAGAQAPTGEASAPALAVAPQILTREDLEKMTAEEVNSLGDRLASGEVKLAE